MNEFVNVKNFLKIDKLMSSTKKWKLRENKNLTRVIKRKNFTHNDHVLL